MDNHLPLFSPKTQIGLFLDCALVFLQSYRTEAISVSSFLPGG
jgi:hypothetical protein